MTGYDKFAIANEASYRMGIPLEEALSIIGSVERDLVALEWERADDE